MAGVTPALVVGVTTEAIAGEGLILIVPSLYEARYTVAVARRQCCDVHARDAIARTFGLALALTLASFLSGDHVSLVPLKVELSGATAEVWAWQAIVHVPAPPIC
jgi:hypothetical protein